MVMNLWSDGDYVWIVQQRQMSFSCWQSREENIVLYTFVSKGMIHYNSTPVIDP